MNENYNKYKEEVLISDEPYPALPQTMLSQLTDKDLIRNTLLLKGYSEETINEIIDECIIVDNGAYDDGYDFPLNSFNIVRKQLIKTEPNVGSETNNPNLEQNLEKSNITTNNETSSSIHEEQNNFTQINSQTQDKEKILPKEQENVDNSISNSSQQIQQSSFDNSISHPHSEHNIVQEDTPNPSNDITQDIQQNVEQNENQNIEHTTSKKRKIIRVVKKVTNKFSKILATAALLSAIVAPLGIVPNTHIEEHQIQVPIEQTIQEEHSSYENFEIGDKVTLTDQAYFETGTLQGNNDIVNLNNSFGIAPGDYDITGVVVLDSNGNRLGDDDNLVDLDLNQLNGENIGKFVSQTCEKYNIQEKDANVSLHFGNQIGWIDAKDVLGPNDLTITNKTIVTGYNTETVQETVQDGNKMDYNLNNVTPIEAAAAVGLAGAAIASAKATKRKNEQNLNEPCFKEFSSKEEYEQWKETELKTSEEEYKKQSAFEKLKQKIIKEQLAIQELTKTQARELRKEARTLSGTYGEVRITDDGNFEVKPYEGDEAEEEITPIDVTQKMYESDAIMIGKDNQFTDEIPLTNEMRETIENLNEGRHR